MPPKRVLGPVSVTPTKPPSLLSSEPDVIESIEIAESVEKSVAESVEKSVTPELNEVVCPICSEKMISLMQLNRHLDDEHVSPSPSEDKSWLKRTNEVKSKIQLQLPIKLARFDIFDGTLSPDSRTSSNSSINEIQVTRDNWQRPTVHDSCHMIGCSKPLNIKNGIINCRRCGFLFCHQHTNYRVKLNASAHYDAMGLWCRCCQDCFINKPGYNDIGKIMELTNDFQLIRQKKVDERLLYQNKLEKRLINLSSQLNKIGNHNLITFNSLKKSVERQLVHWEDDSHVLNCFICLRNFSFTLRKHHCRLCGKVVCGDLESKCSMEVPINHLTRLLDVSKVDDDLSIRMCRHCKKVLFDKKNFQLDIKKPLSPLLQKFETQQNVKKAIVVLMPKFQDVLQRLPNDQLSNVSKLRKRLVDSFALFDKLTKEIVGLTCITKDEQILQLNIKIESASFIQQNMTPLKQLSKFKIEQETTTKSIPKFTREQVQTIKRNRDELMVLQEQKYLVEDMIDTCKKQRRFDEITSLNDNLKELEKSIEQLQLELGDEGF